LHAHAELMHKALLAKGLPCALKIYVGEQHGFRKSENIRRALEAELFFFGKVLGFEPADTTIEPVDIRNYRDRDGDGPGGPAAL